MCRSVARERCIARRAETVDLELAAACQRCIETTRLERLNRCHLRQTITVQQHISNADSFSELRRACAVGRLHENKMVRAELERALLGDQPQECHFFVALNVDEVCHPIVPMTCCVNLGADLEVCHLDVMAALRKHD